ncbi:hypothetical protein DFH94DRAFT_56853 [Russula ochroleuca]|jgi:hypothetical protein|uniref:Uncharacterized protein n=1 Tax=Russula ochroleuca TaxID=152965 RepID=A0A9P5MTM6_9AGAM|nr:hypothetical protein DFH94DRAFT_56853 [Russula ochroleuca]
MRYRGVLHALDLFLFVFSGETDDGNELPNQPGYGLSLWSRVATAASTLTISVSKAWTSNIAMYSGEHTPPGEESRLTRALKAYHIEKARDPTDLPPWLFEEHERRPLGGPGTRRRYREGSEYDHDSHRATAPPRSGGRSLRDIYDAAATTSVIPSRQQETREWSRRRLQDDAPVGPPPSKANDRLKALRDAKRNAAQRNAPVASMQSSHLTGDEGPVYEERGRGYGSDRGDGDGPRRIPPSLPASVRPLRSGVLPPRRTVRKI